MVVGRLPDGSSLMPAGLEVELDQVGLMLDCLDGFVQRLDFAADQQVAFFVHVQDQSILDVGLILDGSGRAGDRADGRAGRSSRC